MIYENVLINYNNIPPFNIDRDRWGRWEGVRERKEKFNNIFGKRLRTLKVISQRQVFECFFLNILALETYGRVWGTRSPYINSSLELYTCTTLPGSDTTVMCK